jgi:hypothetical protein
MSESNSISETPIKIKRIARSKPSESIETVFITTNEATASNLRQVGFSSLYADFDTKNQVPKDLYEKICDTPFVLLLDYDGFETLIEKAVKYFDTHNNISNNWKFLYLPPRGMTWNDLYHNGLLSPDKQKATLEKAYLQGKLHAATSEQDYFDIYRKQYPETTTLIFEFNHRLVKVSLKKTNTSSADQTDELEVKPLTDCGVRLQHSVIDDSLKAKQRTQHHITLYSEREGYNHIIITDDQLMKTPAFKAALHEKRQSFDGTTNDLTELTRYLFESNPPKVRALSAIGYDDESKGYFFPEFTYLTEGMEFIANPNPVPDVDKYVSFTDRTLNNYCYIKPFIGCSDTIIKTIPKLEQTEHLKAVTQFIDQLGCSYGARGLLVFGFYISSLFSHRVFKHYGFFPILSLYGNPSIHRYDKKFLSRLFNRCLFTDSEGQKIKAAFTAESELKKIRQKSNLVCALLDDRGYKSKLDYDTLLPFYNRQALSSNACLAFISSNEGFKNEALNDLVISLQFPNTDNNNTINHVAWYPTTNNPSTLGIVDPIKRDQLNQYTPERLASVGDYLLNNRQHFEKELVDKITDYEKILTSLGITVQKMAQNYAISLGGIICLYELLNIPNQYIGNLVNYTANRALHKQEVIKEPIYVADYFLNLIDGIESNLNYGIIVYDNKKTSEQELIIHLPTVLSYLKTQDQDFDQKVLDTILPKHPRFISVVKDDTKHFGSTRLIHIFKKPKYHIDVSL